MAPSAPRLSSDRATAELKRAAICEDTMGCVWVCMGVCPVCRCMETRSNLSERFLETRQRETAVFTRGWTVNMPPANNAIQGEA